MPVYTTLPIPTFMAESITTQAEADAWVALLDDTVLRNDHDGVLIRDVEITVTPADEENPGGFRLRWKRDDTLDQNQSYYVDAGLGGYCIVSLTQVPTIWAEDKEAFESRYQLFTQ